ncbi:oxidoreductase-like protein [Astrocystis sublimbata]|nr:oxidoreductase-like protein [Astrocystis sublimbata]
MTLLQQCGGQCDVADQRRKNLGEGRGRLLLEQFNTNAIDATCSSVDAASFINKYLSYIRNPTDQINLYQPIPSIHSIPVTSTLSQRFLFFFVKMPPNMRPLMRVARIQSTASRNPQFQRAFASSGGGPLPGGTPGESSVQAMPIGPYYESMLTKPQPIPKVKPEEPPASSPKSPKAKKAPSAKANSPSSSGTTTTAPSSPSSSSSSSSSSTPQSAANTPIEDTVTSAVPPQPTSEPSTAQEKARIIFGSSLAGPAERADRLQQIRDRSVRVAGVLVPPRPEEPDHCCMSGCVNCVWDQYRDELEDWAAKKASADEALASQQKQQQRASNIGGAQETKSVGLSDVAPVSSMDEDGGGSETNWQPTDDMAKTDRPKIAKDLWDEDLYKNVPVGIREFMKHEKKLKKKHEEEGTFGA